MPTTAYVLEDTANAANATFATKQMVIQKQHLIEAAAAGTEKTATTLTTTTTPASKTSAASGKKSVGSMIF